MLGIDPARQREMMDESPDLLIRLRTETEPIIYKSDWFEMQVAMRLKEIWSIAEVTAEEHGQTVRWVDWHLVVGCHPTESREKAFKDIRVGGAGILTEYFDHLGNEVSKRPRRSNRRCRQAALQA